MDKAEKTIMQSTESSHIHELSTSLGDSDMPIVLLKGVRSCTKYPFYAMSNFVSYNSLSPPYRAFSLSIYSIPHNWKEAITNPKWKQATIEDMKALSKNGAWDLVPPSPNKKLVGCKWISL